MSSAAKQREWRYTAWITRRTHAEDTMVPAGETRRPDRTLELNGARITVSPAGDWIGMIDQRGMPIRLPEWFEASAREGREISGILIAVDREEEQQTKEKS